MNSCCIWTFKSRMSNNFLIRFLSKTASSLSSLKNIKDLIPIFLICGTLFLMAACGPEESETLDNNQLLAETHQIARDFINTGDLEQARQQLNELPVANVNEWLLYVTETSISEGTSDTSSALVNLAISNGLKAASLANYLAQNDPISSQDRSLGTASNQVDAQPAFSSQYDTLVPAPDEETASSDLQQQTQAVLIETIPTVPPASPTLKMAVVVENPELEQPVADNQSADITPTAIEATATQVIEIQPTATDTSIPENPQAIATSSMNVRSGPGTQHTIVGSLAAGFALNIVGTNVQRDWWQVQYSGSQLGWVYAPLVNVRGNVANVTASANGAPVPTPVPQAVALVPATPLPYQSPTPLPYQ